MEFNFTVSGRTIELKSINCMEIYCTTDISSTKMSFIKLNLSTFNLNDLEANHKISVPCSSMWPIRCCVLMQLSCIYGQTKASILKMTSDITSSTLLYLQESFT